MLRVFPAGAFICLAFSCIRAFLISANVLLNRFPAWISAESPPFVSVARFEPAFRSINSSPFSELI